MTTEHTASTRASLSSSGSWPPAGCGAVRSAGCVPRTRAPERSASMRRPTRLAGWWVKQAEELEWFRAGTPSLTLQPAVLQWSSAAAERLAQLPGPPCRGRPWRSRRFHCAARTQRARVTYAQLLADVERFANALKDLGIPRRRRRDLLPMIPSRGCDARLRAHRRAAQRRVRGFAPEAVRERMDFRREGPDHRRWRLAQGRIAAIKERWTS